MCVFMFYFYFHIYFDCSSFCDYCSSYVVDRSVLKQAKCCEDMPSLKLVAVVVSTCFFRE